MKKTNYQSAVSRIKSSTNLAALAQVEKGLVRVYEAGFLTASELGRLFVMSMDKAIELSEVELSK